MQLTMDTTDQGCPGDSLRWKRARCTRGRLDPRGSRSVSAESAERMPLSGFMVEVQKTNQQRAMKSPIEASLLKVALQRPAPLSAKKPVPAERNSAELPPKAVRKSTSTARNPVARLELEHAHENRRSTKQEENTTIIDTFRQFSIIYSNKMATTRELATTA